MPSLFTAEVRSFRVKSDDSTVEYEIRVIYNLTKASWTIRKRYSEFDTLLTTLTETHYLLPDLPQKTLWKKTNPDFLERRRVMLQEFLQILLRRRELATCPEVSAFLCIHKHLPEVLLFLPAQLHITNVGLVVHDIIVDGSSIYCIGREESTAYRLETYFKNWSSKARDPIGSAFMIKKNQEEIGWTVPFESNPTALCWERSLTVLAVGMEDGRVVCVRVCTELDSAKYEPYAELHLHYQAVIGIALDYRSAYLYSCGVDNRLCVCELNTEALVAEMVLPGPKVSAFAVYENRAFLATEAGQVHVYEISPSSLIYRVSLNSSIASPVQALSVNKNYIAAGHETGAVSLYAHSDRLNPESQLGILQGIPDVKAIALADTELFVGTKSGCISAWDIATQRIIYSWKAHHGGVYGLYWNEAERQLSSGGWDRAVRLWQLSESWQTPEVLEQQAQFLGQVEVAQPVRRSADEEDDLMGWDS
mmetsp:Transcript_9656/g.18847  ORF Transcript_9656/g.18847 Transcript_9656/m.18847 type:complete len:477 (-) Transcript_9656:3181-4611(-)